MKLIVSRKSLSIIGLVMTIKIIIIKSRAMRKCLMSHGNNKGADQPVHPRSLISAFVVHCLDSIISLDSIGEISRIY